MNNREGLIQRAKVKGLTSDKILKLIEGDKNAIAEAKAKGLTSDEILAIMTGIIADVVPEQPQTTESESGEESLNYRKIITEVLKEIGVPSHIKGYKYLRDAIEYCMQNPVVSVTKELYPEVAKKNYTTASRVERAIRHAIEVAWDRGDVDVLTQYFGCTISMERGKPTNSEFIFRIVDCFKIEYNLNY